MHKKHLTCPALLAFLLLSTSVYADDESEELPSYVLLDDKFVTRNKAAADEVFFAYDQKAISAKLKEFGMEMPKEFILPEDSLIVFAVSDFTHEAFTSMSAIKPKRTFVVDLKADKESEQPKAAPEGKKNSRCLLVSCPPIKGIKAWAIQTADTKRHSVKGTEVKK